jgi:serine/threonine protein kinase
MGRASAERHPIDQLAEEFAERYRRGERPALSDYIRQHPELADEIRDVFPALVLMERFKPVQADLAAAARLERIGDYRTLREVGRGGMGVVYEAEQLSLGRHVALKVLPWAGLGDSSFLERFRREAQAAARLHHTNIVPVFGVGEEDGVHYYAMQFIHGEGLDKVLKELRRLRRQQGTFSIAESVPDRDPTMSVANSLLEGRFAAPEPPAPGRETESSSVTLSGGSSGGEYYRSVARVGLQVAEALAHAHKQGVLHRDIKPSNLILDLQGTAWVTDFGLAKAEGAGELTHPGDIVGTMRYMAPERFDGTSQPQGDIYALGVTLYEMLTLRPAFADTERARLLQRILNEEPPRPRKLDPHIPRDLETIVLKACARAPADRYATAEALAEDLRAYLNDRPIRARRHSRREVAWRWCRRNPALAGLAAAFALACCVGFAGVLWKWREAEQARNQEQLAHRLAEERGTELRRSFDRLKAADALLDRSRWYIREQRWDDADAALTKAIELRRDHAPVWVERGELRALLGLFDLAAEDFASEFELLEPDTSFRWYRLALLRLHFGDRDGYREVCRRMRERFRGTLQAAFGTDVVRTSLLARAPDVDFDAVLQYVKLHTVQARDSWFSLYLVGIAHYRAGHDDQAVRLLQDSLTARWGLPVPDSPLRSLAYPVLAMAHHRLGHAAQARQALADAARALDQWTRTRCNAPPESWVHHRGAAASWPITWWDWLEFQNYYSEARLLIEGTPPPDDVRWHLLRARAFAGLRWHKHADTEYAHVLKQSPEDLGIRLEAHVNRGDAFVRTGEWHRAADEFGAATALKPGNARVGLSRAVTLLAAGDLDAYRQTCACLVARFANTHDAEAAEYVVTACVVAKDALPDMARLLPIAAVLVVKGHSGGNMRGAALTRAGRYDEAVRCLNAEARDFRPRAWHLCFLALAHHGLGQAEEARRCVDEAAAWIDNANHHELDNLTGTQPAWGAWHERVIFPYLLREAQQRVRPSAEDR